MDGTFQIAERGLSGADVVGRLTAAAAASASASGGASGGASGQGSVKRPRLERDASDEQLLFLLKNLDKVRRTKKVSEVLKIFISFLFYSVDRNRPGGLRFRGRRAAALLGQAGNPRKTPTSRRLADAVTNPSAMGRGRAPPPFHPVVVCPFLARSNENDSAMEFFVSRFFLLRIWLHVCSARIDSWCGNT